MNYISKGIVLDEETWKAFDRVRQVHGSYNKALRFMLSAGGVFEPSKTTLEAIETPKGLVSRAVNIATRKPLLKPKERK